MDLIALLVALGLVALVGFMAYQKLQRDERAFSQRYRPVDEHLLDDLSDLNGVIAFAGDAAFETQRFHLEAGRYKLMYWFPAGVPVKVELFSAAGDDHVVIALKQGEGAVEFAVAAPGQYFCVIEPAQDDATWEIEISRLGLPSRAGETI